MKLKNQTVLNVFMANLFERIRSLRWLVTEAFSIVCNDISQVLTGLREAIMRLSGLLSRSDLGATSKVWEYFLFEKVFGCKFVKIETDNNLLYRGERRC